MRQTALLRLIYRGKVRWALPHILVEETPDRVALHIVPGVRGVGPQNPGQSEYMGQLLDGWETSEHVLQWEDWRPDPEWPLPELPQGWDRV